MTDQVDVRPIISSPEKVNIRAVEEVGRFVTRIFEHPLVDEQTRKHRETAVNKLEKFAETYGIDKSNFFTIPVGSLIWATNKESDFEYIMIFDSQESFAAAMSAFNAGGEDEFYQKAKEEKIHILGSSGFLVEDLVPHDNYFDYLFTPDEYIGGNIDLARKARLGIINYIDSKGWDEERWQRRMGVQFDVGIRNWDKNDVPMAFRYRAMTLHKDRTSRINERLEKRALLTSNPEEYKLAFSKARENINVPDFKTYKDAILATNGEVHIFPKYVAQGI